MLSARVDSVKEDSKANTSTDPVVVVEYQQHRFVVMDAAVTTTVSHPPVQELRLETLEAIRLMGSEHTSLSGYPVLLTVSGEAEGGYSVRPGRAVLSSPPATSEPWIYAVRMVGNLRDSMWPIASRTELLARSYEFPRWLLNALRTEASGDLDGALDIVFEALDSHLKDHEYDRLDHLLTSLPVKTLSADVLLTFLTVTLAAKQHLPGRPYLVSRVHEQLDGRGELEPGLLDGLE